MSEKTEFLKKALSRTKQEVAKVIIGQEAVVDKALIAIFSQILFFHSYLFVL